MKRLLVAAGALALASAVSALPSQDPYYYFHEGIFSTSLTDQVPLFEKSLADHPDHNESRHGLGVVYYRRGDLRKAIATFEAELAAGRGSKMTDYDLACCYGLSGDKAKGVEHFRRAVRRGFRDWPLFRTDRDMDPIRDEAGVVALAGKTLAMRETKSEKDDVVSSGSHRSQKAKAKPAAGADASAPAKPEAKPKKPKKEKAAKGKKPKKGGAADSSTVAPPVADAPKPASPDPANPLEEPAPPTPPAPSAAPPPPPPPPSLPPPPPAPGGKGK